MLYKYNDGGRKDAGYKRPAGDCVPRAIAIALDLPYKQVRKELDALNKQMTGGLNRSTQNGTEAAVFHKYLTDRGWSLTLLKNTYLKDLNVVDAPNIIVSMPRHMVAIVNNTVMDTWDSRHSRRTKCKSPIVQGYYAKIS